MNTVDVPRPLLLALAQRTGFPAARVGATALPDEAAWRHAVGHATPTERAELLLSLEGELLRATEGARAWLELRPRSSADVDDEPFYCGDLPLLHVVRTAMALLPDAVRWPIQRTVAFLGVGISSRAWTGPAVFVDAAGQRKRRIVVLGPSADVLTVLHEIGHVWAAGPSRDVEHLLTAQGEAGLLALAVKEGWRDRLAALDRAVLESEQLADGLAFCWLVRKPGGPTA